MKTAEYWEAQASRSVAPSTKDLFGGYWTKRYLDNLKFIKSGKRILDIGCGNARYFNKLEDKFEEFYGVELSRAHFEAARMIFPKGNYVVANGNKLPFRDNCFDAIISFGAFEHNDNIRAILRECYRVPDIHGILLFSVPNYFSPPFPYVYISHSLERQDRVAAIGHHYSKQFLIVELEKAGFCQVKFVDTIYAAPVPIIDLVAGLAKKVGNLFQANRERAKEKTQTPPENKLSTLESVKARLDYHYSKAFYPMERLGFGFMRMVYCQKESSPKPNL